MMFNTLFPVRSVFFVFFLLLFGWQNNLAASNEASDSTEMNTGPVARIINGIPATKNKWPWMAGVLYQDVADNYQALFCGAAIIHPEWVITAAHCLDEIIGEKIDILVGSQSLSSGGRRIMVDEAIIHPAYNRETLENDIALLHLEQKVTQTAVSLSGRSYDLFVVANAANSTALGWGALDKSASIFPTKLRQVDLPVISQQQCEFLLDNNDIQDTHLCAGFYDGAKDTCQGDSGGPLISTLFDETQLIGITSWGNGPGCANGFGVYTRVSKFEQFITTTMCDDDTPEAPVLTTRHSKRSDGNIAITLNFSTAKNVDKYRLYYAPYNRPGENITEVRHIDTWSHSNTYIIAPEISYYVAVQAVKNNCHSPFSSILIAP